VRAWIVLYRSLEWWVAESLNELSLLLYYLFSQKGAAATSRKQRAAAS